MSDSGGSPPAMRIAAGVEYHGAGFDGWQKQPGRRTIQECVESALSRVADHAVDVQCAGRTDAGVHSVQQVIHFDTPSRRADHSWVLGANGFLPRDVNLLWAMEVKPDFHARFSARWRRYVYLILNRRTRTAIYHRLLTWEPRRLDEARMSAAALDLIGEHDFTSYRATACQARSPVRVIRKLCVARRRELVVIEVEANAFLHHMVRNIAGVLMMIGMGKEDPAWAGEVLEARDRTRGGVTAPADGLYLVNIVYDETHRIPMADWRLEIPVTSAEPRA